MLPVWTTDIAFDAWCGGVCGQLTAATVQKNTGIDKRVNLQTFQWKFFMVTSNHVLLESIKKSLNPTYCSHEEEEDVVASMGWCRAFYMHVPINLSTYNLFRSPSQSSSFHLRKNIVLKQKLLSAGDASESSLLSSKMQKNTSYQRQALDFKDHFNYTVNNRIVKDVIEMVTGKTTINVYQKCLT